MSRTRSRAVACAVVLASMSFTSAAHAEGSGASNVRELRHDVGISAGVSLALMGLWLEAELGKEDLAPRACRWCDRDPAGRSTLNALDRGARQALVWQNPATAARISDVLGFAVMPAVAFGTGGAAAAHDGVGYSVDALLTIESVAVSGALNQLVKFSVARERPFVHFRSPEERARPHRADDNLSFYSGHTSNAFTLATASATIATLRNYRLAPLIWATALPIAALTGYLRMAADKHFLTDVLTGAIVGSAVGVLVPVLFHGRTTESDPVAPPAVGVSPTVPTMITFGGGF